jgi:outer membrane protein assembly factor BamD (BamD/ComL family)
MQKEGGAYMKTLLIGAGFIAVFLVGTAYSQDAGDSYAEAKELLKTGDFDLAFMHFRSLSMEHPDSKYAKNALFAAGEYHFLVKNYTVARNRFLKFIEAYPESKAKLFALAYLLNIAKKYNQPAVISKLEKEIVSRKQMVFLFKNFKEYSYASPFKRKLKVVYTIDKMNFYIDGEPLAEISY